jgi:hypothetical protein
MKLSQLAAKPQLIEILMDDEATVREYGEALTFHTWDRQPMDVFVRLANTDQNNIGNMLDIVKNMILDDAGQPVLKDDAMLPTPVLMQAIGRITDLLGK